MTDNSKEILGYINIQLVAESCRRGCSVVQKVVENLDLRRYIDKLEIIKVSEDVNRDCFILNKKQNKGGRFQKLQKKNMQYAVAIALDYIGKNSKYILNKQKPSYSVSLKVQISDVQKPFFSGNEQGSLMTIVCGKEKKQILKTQKHVMKIANKANKQCDYINHYNLRAVYVIETNAPYEECKIIEQQYKKMVYEKKLKKKVEVFPIYEREDRIKMQNMKKMW